MNLLVNIYKSLILLLLLLVFTNFGFAQNAKIDSVRIEVRKATTDTQKIVQWLNLAEYLIRVKQNECLLLVDSSLQLSKKNNWLKDQGRAYNIQGKVLNIQGNRAKAIESFKKELQAHQQIGDSAGMANAYNNIGSTYSDISKNNDALINHLEALKIRERTGDKSGLASTYHNIGRVYDDQDKFNDALDNYFKSLKIKEELNYIEPLGNTYTNIGSIYIKLNKLDEGIQYLEKGKKKYEQAKNIYKISVSYLNLADAFQKKKNYKKAEQYYDMSLKLNAEKNNKIIASNALLGLGSLYFDLKQYNKCIDFILKAEKLFVEIDGKAELVKCYELLFQSYSSLGNEKKAFDYVLKFDQMKDSITAENNENILAEMQEKYESNQKEKEIKLLNQENDIKNLQIARDKIIKISIIGACIILIAIAFILYNSIQAKKKANKALEEKNILISDQKDAIEKQKNNILDSIRYAKRIQQSFLVSEQNIHQYLSSFFILYKPRDIVSGDFYWFTEKDGKILLAAVDCTGHGVPGALMSMLGNRLLNEIVNIKGILEPGKILEELHASVVHDLQQHDDSRSQDGMDMVICSIDSSKGIMEYAAAAGQAYLLEKGEVVVLKGDFSSIGGIRRNETTSKRAFKTFSRPLEPNSVIYMFSDGYQDQFHFETKKKFGNIAFKEIIKNNPSASLDQQKVLFDEAIEAWKGNQPQVDDILVMGVKIS